MYLRVECGIILLCWTFIITFLPLNYVHAEQWTLERDYPSGMEAENSSFIVYKLQNYINVSLLT